MQCANHMAYGDIEKVPYTPLPACKGIRSVSVLEMSRDALFHHAFTSSVFDPSPFV